MMSSIKIEVLKTVSPTGVRNVITEGLEKAIQNAAPESSKGHGSTTRTILNITMNKRGDIIGKSQKKYWYSSVRNARFVVFLTGAYSRLTTFMVEAADTANRLMAHGGDISQKSAQILNMALVPSGSFAPIVTGLLLSRMDIVRASGHKQYLETL